MLKNCLVNRSPSLPHRLLLETDYPYLQPRTLDGIYDSSCSVLATATYLSKTINNPNPNNTSYLHSFNINVKACMLSQK